MMSLRDRCGGADAFANGFAQADRLHWNGY